MAKKKSFAKKKYDLFTVIVAIIVISVALLWYYHNLNDEKEKFTGIDQIFTSTAVSANTDQLNIHFIDVGQGDCIFVQLPDGKNILIDSGDNGKEQVVINYLKGLKVNNITLVIATHADADHTGGMKEVFEAFEIDYCLRPFVYYSGEEKSWFEDSFNVASNANKKENATSNTYRDFLKALLDEKCGYEYFNKDSDFSQTFTYNGVEHTYSVDFYTPYESVPNIGYSDANDYSPIFTLNYNGFSIMLTGDAEKVAENELLTAYPSLPDVDVLKVSHHGSVTSSSEAFLDKIKAEVAVISCGMPNKYNHPRQEVLTRLTDRDTVIYRTDLQGHIVLNVNVNGEYEFTTQKSASLNDLITGLTPS